MDAIASESIGLESVAKMAVPRSLGQIEAANRLHSQLEPWQRVDRALTALRERSPDFEPESTLLKVVAVNSLYGTNVYAVLRVATHIQKVMACLQRDRPGPELVEDLAAVPLGGGEKRPIRRYSFASKFAHFFINAEQFPIFDSYAATMISYHLGPKLLVRQKTGRYLAYVRNFERLADAVGFHGKPRELDRYLWLAGQYRLWLKSPKAQINTDC